MELFWAIIFALSAIVTVVLWGKKELKGKPKKLIYPIAIIILMRYQQFNFNSFKRLMKLNVRQVS